MSEQLCVRCNKPRERHNSGVGCTIFTLPDAPAADELTALRAELAEARETIIAFAGPWAMQYARDFGLPKGHLHPMHYDILAKAGARLDDFTRATLNTIRKDG